MESRIFAPSRRALLAGLGAASAGLIAGGATPSGTFGLALRARTATWAPRAGDPALTVWELAAIDRDGIVRVRRGQTCQLAFRNDLPVPLAPVWSGLGGTPFLNRAPTPPGASETSTISIVNAGTLLADFRLFEDGLKAPARPLTIIAEETGGVAVDRDEVLLVEEWRLRPDGTAIAPGQDATSATTLYTINGRTSCNLSAAPNERLRLRIINGSQRTVLAIKLEGHEVRVMALDGQPAEPFSARNGAVVLAPGARADVFVDAVASAALRLHDGKAARPIGTLSVTPGAPPRPAPPPPQALPANDLPDRLDLRNALRVDLALGGAEAGWTRPASLGAAPAFRAKPGRTVVLAVKNPAPVTNVLHLHGQPFRLLDRLDDGWKPYWLDTLAIEPGQTQRIAFVPTAAGRGLIDSVATDWAAPRLVKWYAIA
jgi:FtsP/CotA-like multicopper oxidase with cupredoxin domain